MLKSSKFISFRYNIKLKINQIKCINWSTWKKYLNLIRIDKIKTWLLLKNNYGYSWYS